MRELLLFIVQLFLAWRGLFSFGLCAAISLYLTTLDPQSRLRFVEGMTSTVLFPIQYVVNGIHSQGNLSRENLQLKLDNAKLRQMVDQRFQESLENRRLHAMLGVPSNQPYPVGIALVIARDVGSQKASCTISLGQSDSIKVGMPVYTIQGLIGQVVRVDYKTALVQLLTGPNARVSVIDDRSRVGGILESTDGHSVHINVPHNSDFKANDEVVTSGLGGVFPKGMPVGRVVGFHSNPMQMMAQVDVLLYQDLNSFEEVFVLKKNDERILRGEGYANVGDSSHTH